MSATETEPATLSRTGRWVAAAMIALALVVFVVVRVNAVRAQDVRSDVYYCTMSGVGLFDEGPNTGRLCADLLSD